MNPEEVRQVVVHPAVWDHLEDWLLSQGILLARGPAADDDLPTYYMTPVDWHSSGGTR